MKEVEDGEEKADGGGNIGPDAARLLLSRPMKRELLRQTRRESPSARVHVLFKTKQVDEEGEREVENDGVRVRNDVICAKSAHFPPKRP